MVFYRIDLRNPHTELSAEAFFVRVFRLFHYRGALRDRLQAEQQEAEDRRGSASTAPPGAPRQESYTDADGTRWVSPDQMQALHPDLF